MTGMSVAVELSGVPETLLWTLYHRAEEARRPDAVLKDPLAVELVDRIDYPFDARFGAGGWRARWQALRALRFDIEVRRFLAARPGATVVALGEGLETQFWRVDDGRVRWVTVELPEVVDAVGSFLPASDRRRVIASSALDEGWLDEVAGPDVMVTAQGLLMYFPRDDADSLIARVAPRAAGRGDGLRHRPVLGEQGDDVRGRCRPPTATSRRRCPGARGAARFPAWPGCRRRSATYTGSLPRADDRAFGPIAPALARVAPALLPQILALRFR